MTARRTSVGRSSSEPGGREPAPGELRTVQLFINSIDIEAGSEEFSTPAALAAWLQSHGLSRRRLRLTHADLERAIAFRELLRSLALRNNGDAGGGDGVAEFNRQLAGLRLVGRLDDAGVVHLEALGSGLDEALGHLAAIVITEMTLRRWSRLKACARDACRWVFYDHSRNRRGTWCTMAICGSRTKVNAYYRRRRAVSRRGRAAAG